MIFKLLAGAAVAWVAWSLVCLEINVRKGRAINVPVKRLPIDPYNIAWLIFQDFLWMVIDRLPIEWSSLPDAVRFSRRGWQFPEKANMHVRLGPVFALATPRVLFLIIADPEAAEDVFARRRDFLRPIADYKILEVYGPSVSTAGSHDWARHRKVLSAPFSESSMPFVWEESLRQGRATLQSWTRAFAAGVPSIQKDTRTLSLNVLASIGMRKSFPFHGSADPPQAASEANNYRDSLQTVLDNIILLLMVPYRFLTHPAMPKSWTRIGHAGAAFKAHLQHMVDAETQARSQGRPGSGGLVTGLVQALEVYQREVAAGTPAADRKGLSLDEIIGDLFVINFAGHDTTANTLAFAVLLLVAHPEIQTWVAEELTAVLGDSPAAEEEWDYKTVYPRLKRCRAVLLETLRLFPPVIAIPKWTPGAPHTHLRVRDQTLTIPAGTLVHPQIVALQRHPAFWPDPDAWLPKRWIVNSAETGGEELYEPPRLVYLPWSHGPMNCPGKKLSEVEFVAVLACLLRRHRLGAVKLRPDESDKEVRKRVLAVANDANVPMLIKMRDADRVRVVCTEA
ncbi:cytochrome P450 monooxygenase [Lasiosphaeria ovina]|uniref:Cytochrome P450 monooxygenase n=1 Tax=Lasiosphaeria ovina TaxID=92902 RepID=A0AAE0TV38_9PEZI|nr:cytochrome P450 monooxygenase [Lasiosphaeria ovina]